MIHSAATHYAAKGYSLRGILERMLNTESNSGVKGFSSGFSHESILESILEGTKSTLRNVLTTLS
jgi:hypothetical protein